MSDRFNGPAVHAELFGGPPEPSWAWAAPRSEPPARLRYVRRTSFCFGCRDGLAPGDRCTTNLDGLRQASLDELAAGAVPGVCPLDLDDEIDRRLRPPRPDTRTAAPRRLLAWLGGDR